MALSQRKTTLAVLRATVGPNYGQEARFAKALGISVSLLKKLCSGNRPITEGVAVQIENETGVSAEWLLAGKTTKPPVTPEGRQYTKAHFESRRALRKVKFGAPSEIPIANLFARVLIMAHSAARQGQLPYFLHKFAKLEDESDLLHGLPGDGMDKEGVAMLLEELWPKDVTVYNGLGAEPRFFASIEDLLKRKRQDPKCTAAQVREIGKHLERAAVMVGLWYGTPRATWCEGLEDLDAKLSARLAREDAGQPKAKTPKPPKAARSSRRR